jgi:hypothetical protein
MEVFPIPPAPMRAMGVRFSARATILSISSSRPKHALGGGGGNSSRGILDTGVRIRILGYPRSLTWLESKG